MQELNDKLQEIIKLSREVQKYFNNINMLDRLLRKNEKGSHSYRVYFNQFHEIVAEFDKFKKTFKKKVDDYVELEKSLGVTANIAIKRLTKPMKYLYK